MHFSIQMVSLRMDILPQCKLKSCISMVAYFVFDRQIFNEIILSMINIFEGKDSW